MLQGDSGSDLVRKINLSSAFMVTLAGQLYGAGFADGTGSAANFFYPYGVAMDAMATSAFVVGVTICHVYWSQFVCSISRMRWRRPIRVTTECAA